MNYLVQNETLGLAVVRYLVYEFVASISSINLTALS